MEIQHMLRAMFFCGALLAAPAFAQIHGVPASATSLGPNGFTGVQGSLPPFIPAGATSLGPEGFTPNQSSISILRNQGRDFDINDGRLRVDRLGRHAQPFFVPLMYSPLYYPMSSIPEEETRLNDRYRARQTGAAQEPTKLEITIVDKRGGLDVQTTTQTKTEKPVAAGTKEDSSSEAPTAEDVAAKILVMRDGSKKEIRSYAILGKNLFDLADGHQKRIPLEEIDGEATAKLNEANGVDFKLP
jgi:hypothetical protein